MSELLSSYRAFYVEAEDSDIEEQTGDAESAQIARSTFKAIFENRLNSAEDEELLLQEEEEDVLNVFMSWTRETDIPQTARTENFPDIQTCLDRVMQLTTAPVSAEMFFIQRIT